MKPKVEPVIGAEEILSARKVLDTIYVDEKILDYILHIVFATRYPKQYETNIEGLLEFGASPRANTALKTCGQAQAFLQGRGHVTPHDIKSVAYGRIRHRIRLSYEAEAEELTADDVISRVLESILVP